MNNQVRVWVWIYLIQDWKILMGLRKSKHGEWSYSPPWWHLEYNETIQECAIRELSEETGIDIDDVVHYGTTDDFFQDTWKHYITIHTCAKGNDFTPKVLEKDKCTWWKWMTWEEIKALWDKNFLSLQNFIKKYPKFDPTKF